ncbi:MAG: hypothetical protein HY964_00810 [Ignavibacteriales bacterium]|nr:hypothetical protein [Ignavibacteriales bacterium]
MKIKIMVFAATLLCLFNYQFIFGQGYNSHLSMQGIENSSILSSASRSMGGITINSTNDVSIMFANPAALQSLDGFQASFGAIRRNTSASQTQQWYPLSYYSNFSLLMQGLTRYIPDPETIRNYPPNAGDSVQRPFDNIEPDWKYSRNKIPIAQIFFGAPFQIGDIKLSAAIGIVEYANMDYRYQNNNMLSPDFGSYRYGVFILPTSDRDVDVKNVYWYQNIKQRIGSIYGYGGGLSIALTEKISIGFSGLYLNGQTDDFESSISRGVLKMHRNYFGLYRYLNDTIKTGTSDFTGADYAISGLYKKQNFTFGISVKPATIIKRKFSGTIGIDTLLSNSSKSNLDEADKIKIPLRGTIGIGMALRENVFLGMQYEYLPYSLANYTSSASSHKPWLDASSFRVGIDYQPVTVLSLRAGYYTKAEIFEPEGNFNKGDPVSSSGYTGGFGINFKNIHINFAYEYLKIEYEDKWSTNVNVNKDIRQNISSDIVFTIPW